MTDKVAVVVPTIRDSCIREFLGAWGFETPKVYVVEDNANKTFDIGPGVTHLSHEDIEMDLGDKAWIIPRKTDCIRSYGFWKAWKDGADYIVTLDDDCFPLSPLDGHIQALSTPIIEDAWERTGGGIRTRGFPIGSTWREKRCVLNHGLWAGIPDVDARTQMAGGPLLFVPEAKVVPAEKFFPMCGMNLAFSRDLTPAMYFLLMGRNYEYDRFGDIWCGLFAKKICDHFGWGVRSGYPIVRHERASKAEDNLRKETPGYPENEKLWQIVDKMRLTGLTVSECYKQIARNFPVSDKYWGKTTLAMVTWAELFE
jgi:hypothetical protein